MKNKEIIEKENLSDIYPTSVFVGNNIIENDAVLTNCILENCVVEGGVEIKNAILKNANVHYRQEKSKSNLFSKEYFRQLLKYDNNFFDDIKIVLCAQNDESGIFLKEIFERLHAQVEYICLTDVKFENLAEVCARQVTKLAYNLGIIIDENAGKIFAVNCHGEILNGDDILFLLTWWFASQNKILNNKVCGSVLTNTGIENKLKSFNIYLQRGQHNEKSLIKNMKVTNAKLGALQSGEVLIFENEKIYNDAMLIARILLTIYYENANIWEKVKENNVLQIFKIYCLKDKMLFEQNVKVIADFYKLKTKNKARIETWQSKNKIYLLIESTEKSLNYIIYKEINKKINKLIKNKGF